MKNQKKKQSCFNYKSLWKRKEYFQNQFLNNLKRKRLSLNHNNNSHQQKKL